MPQDTGPEIARVMQPYPLSDPVESLTPKPFGCPRDPNLYPTHPSQILKEYHQYDVAQYDSRSLDARDEECMLSQIEDKRPGARNRRSPAAIQRIIDRAEETGRRIPCQIADEQHRVIMSDTYIDTCGNYYRGVKQIVFEQQYESDGTLFSAGRTNYRVPNAVINERFDGGTYPVAHTEFLFLAELLPTDRARIDRERARARQTHTLDSAGRIFTVRG